MGAADELRALARTPAPERKALLVALLNERLPKGKRAVLVGGALVELYTAGAHVTGDVDVVGEAAAIVPVLRRLGFARDGRVYAHPDLDVVVDVAGLDLRPTEEVVEIEVAGRVVPAVSIEDAIVDRLLAAKFWASATDWEQAVLLHVAHAPRLRQGVLRARAAANDVADRLADLERAARPDG